MGRALAEVSFIIPVVSRDLQLVKSPSRPTEDAPDTPTPASIEAAKAGDPTALEAIARSELPRVTRLLRRLLGPREDLEDLVQTVFLELCRALPRFRGDSALSTFVGGITVQVARRAMRPTAWVRFRSEADTEPTSRERPDHGATRAEQVRRIRAVLEDIAPKKRIAFSLWAFEGMDVRAIAKMTGASVSATRSRIFYAQKALKAEAAADPYLRELLEGVDDA